MPSISDNTRRRLLGLVLLLGAPLAAIAQEDVSALSDAVWSGDQEKVATLLRRGADVNARDTQGYTPLMQAAFRGDKALVEQLLDAGAQINAATMHGHTALMDAAGRGRADIVALLLARGANVNAVAEQRSVVFNEAHTYNALSLAGDNGDTAVTEELRNAGAHEPPPVPVANAAQVSQASTGEPDTAPRSDIFIGSRTPPEITSYRTPDNKYRVKIPTFFGKFLCLEYDPLEPKSGLAEETLPLLLPLFGEGC